jgi:hypothetical protein
MLVLCLSGCSGKSLQEKLTGRWAEEKTQRSVEFTEQQLYAIFANGEPVESGVWKADGDEVVLEVFGGPKRGEIRRWKPEFEGDEKFTLSQGKAFLRSFLKIKEGEKIFDERLVGLWQTDAEFPEVVAFSPRGVAVGWSWRVPDKEGKGEPFVVGTWAKVTRGSFDFFRLEGYVGTMNVTSARGHAFRIDGGKLAWRKPSRRKEDVFRKVSLSDLKPSTLSGTPPSKAPASPQP